MTGPERGFFFPLSHSIVQNMAREFFMHVIYKYVSGCDYKNSNSCAQLGKLELNFDIHTTSAKRVVTLLYTLKNLK